MTKKQSAFLAILFLVSVASLIGCGSGSWKEFSSSKGRFSAFFPNKPTEEVQTLNSAIGPLKMHIFMAQSKEGFFVVGYVDYPDTSYVHPSDLLDAGRDGALENTQGKLLSETIISLGGYPGREIKFKVETPKGVVITRSRFYIVKNRLYSTSVTTTKKWMFSENVLRFLDSFRVTAY